MGVHDLSKYPEVKRLFEIPNDEPIFILRGKDVLYPATLGAYQGLYMSVLLANDKGMQGEHWSFFEHIDACRDNAIIWQRRNKDKVRIPD